METDLLDDALAAAIDHENEVDGLNNDEAKAYGGGLNEDRDKASREEDILTKLKPKMI